MTVVTHNGRGLGCKQVSKNTVEFKTATFEFKNKRNWKKEANVVGQVEFYPV